ncbi:MAG: PIN domain nuclease [Thermoprotei archaeon]|nr:MAG: PIN domain nuclease [Thermoprotei archaeon]RLF24479.1 MAG: PIN domain nuclease [Thermoprotei archaeon]
MKIFMDANLFIYLNTMTGEHRRAYEDFYLDMLSKYKAYTDTLVLDELLYISWKRFKIPYRLTIDFIHGIILPYITILSLGRNELEVACDILLKYDIKPSDALHIAAMRNNGIRLIASEDKEFDKVHDVKRIWMD